MVVVTREHLDAAMAAGACGVDRFKPGMDAADVTFEDLCWFEDHCPDLARAVSADVPIWALAGYGSGSGYGYGSGYGSGSGLAT